MQEEESGGIDSISSSPSAGGGDMDMLTCSRPNMMERRLRPPHDQALKCPRCDSTHTKFCYYNNYSLSQPRYFCKTCRRYWTKGGNLRNIPVGGGCRKNKKPSSSSKKPSSSSSDHSPISTPHDPTDPHLSFPADIHLLGAHHLNNVNGNPDFMEAKYNAMLQESNHHHNIVSARPIEFMMESKLEAIVGNSSRNNNYDFMGGDHVTNFHGFTSTFGMGIDHLNNNINNSNNVGGCASSAESCQRLMLPYEVGTTRHHDDDHQNMGMDVKPKLLSLEWQDQQQGAGKDSFGYVNAIGSWGGMISGYGSSATNPFV